MKAFLERVVGSPMLYDCVQRVAGRAEVARHLAPWLAGVTGRVLDVGGGTGQLQQQLHRDVSYACVDLEMPKLLVLKRRSATAAAFVADAAALPFRSGTIDTVLLFAVLHHLSEDAAQAVCAEIRRVLASRGQLIVLDPVWAPRRLVGRALWSIDRGSHRRTAAAIETLLGGSFRIVKAMTFTVLHEYCLFRCERARADAA